MPRNILLSLICCFLLLSCSPRRNESSRSDSLLKASIFVQRYGQITNQSQNNYLKYLQERLADALKKGSHRQQDYTVILLNTNHPIAASVGDGVILISKGIIKSLMTEAELAFIMSHEMAHFYLRHEISENPESPVGIDETKELEADKLAFATIAAAGYDPRFAIPALKNTYRYSMNLLLDSEAYPSLEVRENQIHELIQSSGWNPPGSINRSDFKEFRRSLF